MCQLVVTFRSLDVGTHIWEPTSRRLYLLTFSRQLDEAAMRHMSSTPTLSQPPDLRAVATIATFLLESIPMYSIEQTRLDPLYATMLCALQLQGKAEKTVEAYARRPAQRRLLRGAASTT